jgi:protein-tyrosine phosphatase
MNNLVDIHTHILPGIDDGSKNISETLEILKKMSSLGFNTLVFTPHYITGTVYNTNNQKKLELLELVKAKLKEENISLNLYLGNEIFIDNNIYDYIKNGEMSLINNSRYFLVELPRNGKINDFHNIVFTLKSKGYIPILAHIERYQFIFNDLSLIDEIISYGALIQVNYESIIGKYGKNAKKVAKYLLKNKKLHFLASDIHHMDSDFFKTFPKIKKKIIKYIGLNKFYEVTYINPMHVINDETF